jgi:uncharacterized membrane protein
VKGGTARDIHRAFEVGMLAKGLFAAGEIASGLVLAVFSTSAISRTIGWLAHEEMAHRPPDAVAAWLMHLAASFSMSTKSFAALYLVSHGAIKLALVVALLRGRLWAYPVSIAAFGAFIAYQLYRYTFTHSPFLLALTVIDIVVVALVVAEWRARRLAPVEKAPR